MTKNPGLTEHMVAWLDKQAKGVPFVDDEQRTAFDEAMSRTLAADAERWTFLWRQFGTSALEAATTAARRMGRFKDSVRR